MLVYDYTTASIPANHPDFLNRIDLEIDQKWAPYYDQTRLEFPTYKIKAPPPPRGKADSASTGVGNAPHPALLTYGERRAQYLRDNPPTNEIATEEEMEA